MMTSKYLYFFANKGSEKLLKEELKLKYPQFDISYSRGRFLTYKVKSPRSILFVDKLDVIFAYSFGLSVEKASRSTLIQTVSNLLNTISPINKLILNPFDRELDLSLLYQQFQDRIKISQFSPSDLVLDIIKTNEDEYFIGIHKLGGYKTIISPDGEIDELSNPPSRAYYKIKEAITLSDEKIKNSQTVLDIGSSPGGVSYFFLQQSLKVVGIDSAKMHESCLENKNFIHIRQPLEKVAEDQLRQYTFDWVVIDINLDPNYVLSQLKKLLTNSLITYHIRSQLKGVFFTVKLTSKFSLQKIPSFLQKFQKLGFKIIFYKQLPSNKSEFTLFVKPIYK